MVQADNASIKGKRALVINMGWEQETYVQRLNTLGVEVFAVHHDQNYSRNLNVREVLVTNYFNVNAITEYARSCCVDAVITDECDYALYASAVVAERLDLPGPGVEPALLTTNKFLQRERISGSTVKQPKYRLCLSPNDVEDFGCVNGYPVVVKPVDSRGSFGVNKVSDPKKATHAFWSALEQSPGRMVLVEDFIHGLQITVDGFCRDGLPESLAVASKKMLDDETQVAVDISYPAEMKAEIVRLIGETNEMVATELGIKFGATHAEYMLTSEGEPYLLEMANRGGGCYTATHIVPAVSGYNTVDQLIFDAFGLTDVRARCDKFSSVLLKFFRVDGEGVIQEVKGIEEMKMLPEVLQARANIKAGDRVEPITTDASRHGFVIVRAPPGTLDEGYARALERLQISFAES